MTCTPSFLSIRLDGLRHTPGLCNMLRETRLDAEDLIYPVVAYELWHHCLDEQ